MNIKTLTLLMTKDCDNFCGNVICRENKGRSEGISLTQRCEDFALAVSAGTLSFEAFQVVGIFVSFIACPVFSVFRWLVLLGWMKERVALLKISFRFWSVSKTILQRQSSFKLIFKSLCQTHCYMIFCVITK